LYCGISEVFTLSPPSSKDSDNIEPQIGIFGLFFAELVALASMVFFLVSKKKIERLQGLEDAKKKIVPDDTNE
jgi:hypothetical protein